MDVYEHFYIIETMRKNSVCLNLACRSDAEPEIEAQTTFGYLTEIQKQLERTADWGYPCVSLEIARNPKMVGRIGAHVIGEDYEKISGGMLGPNYTPYNEAGEKIIEVNIQLDRKQMIELATINDFDTGKEAHQWTTTVSHETADSIIKQIDQL